MDTLTPALTPSNTPINQAYEVREKLAQLEEMLLANTPNMASLLRDIHRQLKADPDVVTILSDTEVSILVRGLKKQTNIEIAVKALKAAPRKSMKSMGVSDF